MQVTTTRRGPKSWAWSYSKLKNFRVCPKRYYHCDVAKDVPTEESEQLLWGNVVHKALADRLARGTPLPEGMDQWETLCKRILDGSNYQLLVEQKMALREDFSACGWFDNDAWFRGIGDVIKITGPVALVADFKTGKVIEDSEQLALMAACVFGKFPNVQVVRSEFMWLKENAETSAIIKRTDMPGIWAKLMPDVKLLKRAHDLSEFPAKPNNFCKRWCVVSQCAHHGG